MSIYLGSSMQKEFVRKDRTYSLPDLKINTNESSEMGRILSGRLLSDLFATSFFRPKKISNLTVVEGKSWLNQLNQRLQRLERMRFQAEEICPEYSLGLEPRAKSAITRSLILAISYNDVGCFSNLVKVVDGIDLQGVDENNHSLFDQIPNKFLDLILYKILPEHLPVTSERFTILHQACLAKDLQKLTIILKYQKTLINRQDKEGRTALHLVAKEGDEYIELAAKLLAEKAIDLNICSISFGSPLFSAVVSNKNEIQSQMIRLFLSDPRCNVNCGSVYNVTPFEILISQRILFEHVKNKIKEKRISTKKNEEDLQVLRVECNKVRELTHLFLERWDLDLLPRTQFSLNPQITSCKACIAPKMVEPDDLISALNNFVVSEDNKILKDIEKAFKKDSEEYKKIFLLQKNQMEELNIPDEERTFFKALIEDHQKQEYEFKEFIEGFQEEAREEFWENLDLAEISIEEYASSDDSADEEGGE